MDLYVDPNIVNPLSSWLLSFHLSKIYFHALIAPLLKYFKQIGVYLVKFANKL